MMANANASFALPDRVKISLPNDQSFCAHRIACGAHESTPQPETRAESSCCEVRSRRDLLLYDLAPSAEPAVDVLQLPACLETVGTDEQEFAIAFNDIDFCLRAVSRGFRVVWTPFATLIHHESATRVSDAPIAAALIATKPVCVNATAPARSRIQRSVPGIDRSEPSTMLLDKLPGAR
jgi:hypothetical protein